MGAKKFITGAMVFSFTAVSAQASAERRWEDIDVFSYVVSWQNSRRDVMKYQKSPGGAMWITGESIQSELNKIEKDISDIENLMPRYRMAMRAALKKVTPNDLTQKISRDLDKEDTLFTQIYATREQMAKIKEAEAGRRLRKKIGELEEALYQIQLTDWVIKEGNTSGPLMRKYRDLIDLRRNLRVLRFGGELSDVSVSGDGRIDLGLDELLTRLRALGWKPSSELPLSGTTPNDF